MRRGLLSFLIFIPCFVLLLAGAKAFLDEVSSLRAELVAWETSNTANFGNVMKGLDEIEGTVFSDVGQKDWFAPYVTSLAEWGVVSGLRDASGKSTGEYKPGRDVTIAEMLKMAMKSADVNMEECPATTTRVGAGHWAVKYVSCAEQSHMRLLDPARKVNIDRPATRAEVLTIIHDAFGDKVPALYSNYKDTAGHALEPDIAYATLAGLVSGDTDSKGNAKGTFRPDGAINRAEAAKIVYERLKLDARGKMAKGEAQPGT